MSEPGLVDVTGRPRSPAATPGHWAGCVPPNKGLRFQGLRGLQGLQGVPGQNGATSVIVRTATITGLLSGSQQVQCNPGERAVGGGAAPSDFSSLDRMFASAPTTATGVVAANGSTPTGWIAGIQNSSATDTTFYVVFASP